MYHIFLLKVYLIFIIFFIFFCSLGNQETRTAGGYSASHTVHEDFVLKIPDGMDLEKTAPILCAGITMYSPLMHWGAGSGEKKTVGIVGIGKFNLTLLLPGGITKPLLPVYCTVIWIVE